jgi:hypothetical protein
MGDVPPLKPDEQEPKEADDKGILGSPWPQMPPPGSRYPAGSPGDQQPPPSSVYPPSGLVPLPGFPVPPLRFPPPHQALPPLGPAVQEAKAAPETPPKEAG